MKIYVALVFAGTSFSATFSVKEVAFVDCQDNARGKPCESKIHYGDSTFFSSWSNKGSTVFNGSLISGSSYGILNDLDIWWRDESNVLKYGPYCQIGGSVIWLNLHDLDMVTGSGAIKVVNCMSGYGTTPGDLRWPPAADGTCSGGGYMGTTSPCNWNGTANICVDGVCYLMILRNERGGPPNGLHDASLIKSVDGGLTWTNPAHIGGSSHANGDPPAGPGDSTYAASILWPDPPSHNGIDQKMGRCEFVQYGRDGAPWLTVDNNLNYVYALCFDGAYKYYHLARVLRANMANLSASDWSYYACPAYATSVCDGMLDGSWSSVMANATPVSETAVLGLGGIMYSADLQTYISTGGNLGRVPIGTAPHVWGPWKVSAIMSANPVPGANLGTVTPMLMSVEVIAAGSTIRLTSSATTYNHDASGSPAFVTYEVSRTPSVRGNEFPPPRKRPH